MNALPEVRSVGDHYRKARKHSGLLMKMASLALLTITTTARADYSITYLGPVLGNRILGGVSINKIGQVVGTVNNEALPTGVLWNVSSPTIPAMVGVYNSSLNDKGQITGDLGFQYGGYVLTGSTYTRLKGDWLWPNFFNSTYGKAINNAGQVAGYSQMSTIGDPSYATVWNGGVPTYLTTPYAGTTSRATDINNVGQVVGHSTKDGGFTHATVWNGSVATELITPTGESSFAMAISDVGAVVGYTTYHAADGRPGSLATLWDGGAVKYLSDGTALDVNRGGQIVGKSGFGATLWDGDKAVDLNTFVDQVSGWYLSSATSINEYGAIAGTAWNAFTRMNQPFVLSPVPEPSTLTLLLAGSGFMFALRRGRRIQPLAASSDIF